MPTCVSCRKFSPNKKDFHEFTSKNHLRPLWLNALTPDDTAKAELDFQLSTASGRQYVCVAHFSPDSFIEGSRVLKSNATPMSMVSTIVYSKIFYHHRTRARQHHRSKCRPFSLYREFRRPTMMIPYPTHLPRPQCCLFYRLLSLVRCLLGLIPLSVSLPLSSHHVAAAAARKKRSDSCFNGFLFSSIYPSQLN